MLLFGICFSYLESSAQMINNTASATLRQLFVLVFERMEKMEPHEQSKEGEDSIGPHTLDSYCLFKDLCYAVNEQKGPFLQISNISPEFALEMIESIVGAHSETFKNRKEFCSLLHDPFCVVVIDKFLSNFDYAVNIRLCRIMGLLIREYHDLLVSSRSIFTFCALSFYCWCHFILFIL